MRVKKIISANLAEMFLQAGRQWGSRPAFATRVHQTKDFSLVSYSEWCERSLDLATALIDLGIKAREHVGIFSDNRFDWIVADAAIQFCGAADVPRERGITSSEASYILNHADINVLFLESRALLKKISAVSKKLVTLSHIIVMDEDFSEEFFQEQYHLLSLASLERQGKALRALGDQRVQERINQISPEDVFTIIYTSGTTGVPKGVQLTHGAICSQIKNLPLTFTTEERALSLLPIWHSYERVFEMVIISCGGCTYYSSLRSLADDFQRVQPTIMASTPRLWEALYQKIYAIIDKQGFLKKVLFKVALRCTHTVYKAERYFKKQELDLKGCSIISFIKSSIKNALQWIIAIIPFWIFEHTLLTKLRKVVGGSLKATISGGGSLPLYIDTFFNDIGIYVLEGYGLTESSPVLAVRTLEHLVLGTVGPPLPETEIRIVDLSTHDLLYPDNTRSDHGYGRVGEIYARGPQIMKGYYKDEKATSQALRDGWLRTGDIGLMTFNGCLKIIGRCKETIVLLNGENVEPQPIESQLLQSPLIDQCIVVGQDQKHLGVLIVPSLEALSAVGIEATSLGELEQQEEKIKPLVQKEIKKLISFENGFKAFEQIYYWKLLAKPFEVGNELTSTYKLKRHVIVKQYEDLLRELFKN